MGCSTFIGGVWLLCVRGGVLRSECGDWCDLGVCLVLLNFGWGLLCKRCVVCGFSWVVWVFWTGLLQYAHVFLFRNWSFLVGGG